ncbi:hypothetical protein [Mycoplasma zalophi]|uniref:hypothetical protein n=1 Tax=Mycoplasma zalophi TaxID=191287 RepID=UPI001C108036|nr:hypothetical protein [Mycoplasma zalophi]MBU4690838.1 hypothetical protein [Mycoplasma zalophi]
MYFQPKDEIMYFQFKGGGSNWIRELKRNYFDFIIIKDKHFEDSIYRKQVIKKNITLDFYKNLLKNAYKKSRVKWLIKSIKRYKINSNNQLKKIDEITKKNLIRICLKLISYYLHPTLDLVFNISLFNSSAELKKQPKLFKNTINTLVFDIKHPKDHFYIDKKIDCYILDLNLLKDLIEKQLNYDEISKIH